MLVTNHMIQGYVMKAIKHVSFFHKDKYHKRFFKLEFGEQHCHFLESEDAKKVHQSYLQEELLSCELLDDEQVKEILDEREEKRSRSFFRRVLHKETQQCSWNFAFRLVFADKEYELYAATRKDREQWVKVLGTIAEMNRQCAELGSPFEYQQEQERKQMKMLEEEQKLTETERVKSSEQEMQEQVLEQVQLWFKLNTNKLAEKDITIEPYDSHTMRLRKDRILSSCFVVARMTQSQKEKLTTQYSSKVEVGQFAFFRAEMRLSMNL